MRANMQLVFGTTSGGTHSFTINGALDTTNQTLVRNSMDNMISANALDTRGKGDIATRSAATLIKINETVFDVS